LGKFVGITGTPGTGKKTLAPIVAAALHIPCFSLNDLAVSYGLAKPSKGSSSVDASLLGQRIQMEFDYPALLYGHLFPYALRSRSVSKVVVLRCEPAVLKKRLRSRGYSAEKVLENVEAELIGVISSDCYRSFGEKKVVEFDATKARPSESGESIADLIRGETVSPRIDWIERYDLARKLRTLLSVPRKVA
jgi:adenylate kinase